VLKYVFGAFKKVHSTTGTLKFPYQLVQSRPNGTFNGRLVRPLHTEDAKYKQTGKMQRKTLSVLHARESTLSSTLYGDTINKQVSRAE